VEEEDYEEEDEDDRTVGRGRRLVKDTKDLSLFHSSCKHTYISLVTLLSGVFRLAESPMERIVAVLDSMSYLSLHGDEEKNDEVEEQYGPEDGNVKDPEKSHAKRGDDSPGARVPKLELGQPSCKRPKLLRLACGQPQVRVDVIGVKLRRQKPDKLVQ